MSMKIQKAQEMINLAGKQRMLLTQHEFGPHDHTETIEQNEIELGESLDGARRYFDNTSSYTETLAMFNERVESRVDNTRELSNVFVVVSSVIALLDLSVLAICTMLYAFRGTTVSELTSVLKMLSHDFKGSIINLIACVEELEGHARLKAELEHVIHSIQSMDHRVRIADGTGILNASDEVDVKDLINTLTYLFDFDLEIHDHFSLKFKPDLLHVVMYQLLRNAQLHGGGKTSCIVFEQDGFGVITLRNSPGENHSVLLAAGDGALKLAMSGAVAKASSSSLGLSDISQIMGAYAKCAFSLKWYENHVESELRVPIARKILVDPEQTTEGVAIRMCFIDDEVGPRMTAKKVIKLVHPGYCPPADVKKNRYVWEDDLVKVGATEPGQIDECLDWVNVDPLRTIVLLDIHMEFPGRVINGMDLIGRFGSRGALVVIRSGNDTDDDRARYIAAGAFGCVGKLLKGSAGEGVVGSAIKAIRNNMQRVEEVELCVLPGGAAMRVE